MFVMTEHVQCSRRVVNFQGVVVFEFDAHKDNMDIINLVNPVLLDEAKWIGQGKVYPTSNPSRGPRTLQNLELTPRGNKEGIEWEKEKGYRNRNR
jgi:hypothetical protein